MAETIAQAAGAELYELTPAEPYTSDDLRWTNPDSRVNTEHNDPAHRTAIAGELPDLSAYDTIFLGYPNWWNTMPMVLFTFLEHYDWTGTRIIPFCTNEGSGIGDSVRDIKKICKGADVDSGASFTGSRVSASERKIVEWAKSKL